MTLKLNNFESLLDDLSLVSLPIISYSCSKNNLFLTVGFQYLSSLLRNFISPQTSAEFRESYFNLPSFKVICFGHLFTKFTSLTSHLYCLSACILCVSFQNFTKFQVNCFAMCKSLYHAARASIPSFHFCPTFTDVICYSGCAVIHCLLLKVLLPPLGLYMLDLPVILEIAFL